MPIVVPALIAGAILAYSLIPKKTTVPSLRGRTAAAALVLLQKSHLKAATNPPREVPNKHIARGRVVSQTPKAGSHVKNNTVVTFTIAEPLVPNLLGKNQSQAKLILGGRGLVLSTSPPETKISQKPPGTIIGQVPGPGAPPGRASQVSIIVGDRRPACKKVPNVVGLTLAPRTRRFVSGGLTIVLPTVPPGQDPTKVTIASQIPTGRRDREVGPAGAGLPGAAAQAAADEAHGAEEARGGRARRRAPPRAAVAAAGRHARDREAVRRREAGHGDQRADAGLAGPAGADRRCRRAGYPQIAYSDGRSILRHERRQGKGHGRDREERATLEDEPTWQPNGTLVAYRRGPSNDPNTRARSG